MVTLIPYTTIIINKAKLLFTRVLYGQVIEVKYGMKKHYLPKHNLFVSITYLNSSCGRLSQIPILHEYDIQLLTHTMHTLNLHKCNVLICLR